jgi:hypothetical protein
MAQEQQAQQMAIQQQRMAQQQQQMQAQDEDRYALRQERAATSGRLNTGALNAELSQLSPETEISAGTHQQMIRGGVLPERMSPVGITPQAPPPSLAAVDQAPEEPMPGTIANSPAPEAMKYLRTRTAPEQQTKDQDAQMNSLISAPDTPPAAKLLLRARLAGAEGALPASVMAGPMPVNPEPERHNRAMEGIASRRVAASQSAVGQGGSSGGADPRAIADAIVAGDQPPSLQGLYRVGPAVRTELAKQGYNLTGATLDWKATERHMNTLNGPQQTRMRQAVDNAYHSLDVIEDLAKQWDGTGRAADRDQPGSADFRRDLGTGQCLHGWEFAD